jgi:hypothetical protein
VLDFIAIGPGHKKGGYYAGYVRPGTRIFVPLVDCDTKAQAESAADELQREAAMRERAAEIATARFVPRNVVRGFYDDDVQV